MADLTEASGWTAGIRRVDVTTPWKGYNPAAPGDGIGEANFAASDLANRTLYLKNMRIADKAILDNLTSNSGADSVGYGTGVTVKDALDSLTQGQAAGTIGFATRALLDADLNHAAGTVAYVTNDATSSNNGTYRKVGGSGSGSWAQSSYDRIAVVEGRVTTLENQFNLSTQTIGIAPEAGSAVGANTTFIITTPATVTSKLMEFRCYAGTAGTLGFKVLRDNGDGTVTVVQTAEVTITGTGLKTLSDGADFNDIIIPAGGYLGVSIYTGQAVLTYGAGSSGSYWHLAHNISGTVSKGNTSDEPLLWAYDLFHTEVTIASLVAGIDTLNSEMSSADSRLTVVEDQINEHLAVTPQTIGASPVTGSTAGEGYTYIIATPVAVESKLSQFTCYATVAGAVKLKVIRDNSNGTGTVLSSATLTLVTGLNTFVDGVAFNDLILPAGGLLGISHYSGGGKLTYNDAGSGIYYAVAGDISGDFVIPKDDVADLLWEFILNPTGTVVAEPAYNEYQTLLESIGSFGSLPLLWVNAGSTWTFGSGKASSGAVGLTNQLRADRPYGLDHRVQRWEFQITNANTVVNFLTNPTETEHSGSVIRFNSSTNVLEVLTAYTGSNTPTVLHSEALGFSLATGKRYAVEWENFGRTFTVRLWNKSGSEYFTYTRVADCSGNGPDQGQLHGKPGVAVTTGSADIYSFAHYAIGAQNPALYMIGDSITEGYDVTDAEKFTTLVRARFDDRQVHASGVEGAIFTGALIRMRRELQYLHPKYVFIYLGTNAGGESDLPGVVALAQSKGATVLVGTVPTSAGTTAAINALGSDVKKVAFDLALTETGAGSAVIEGYYLADHLHPNPAGHLQMLNRILLDAPEIFR